jgi:hypothetical protein
MTARKVVGTEVEVARMSSSTAMVLFGGGAASAAPVTDGELEFLVYQIEQALRKLPVKDGRIFAAEFCGDEIPSVMDGVPVPVLDFDFPLPDWAAA